MRPRDRAAAVDVTCRHGAANAWTHWCPRQPALPRRDDVRRLGRDRPRRVRSASSTGRSTPGSTSSTRPTSTRAASPRRSSARRSAAGGATTWCSRRSSTARWARIPTRRATRGAGSSARSRPRSRACGPTGSTSTRCTAGTPGPITRRRSARSRTSSPRARSATSAPRPTPPRRSCKRPVGRQRAGLPALRLRAAAVLDPGPRDRGRRTADLPGARYGRHRLEPARRRLAVGPLAQGRRRPDVAALGDDPRALRPLDPGQPGQARGRRRARRNWPTRRASR